MGAGAPPPRSTTTIFTGGAGGAGAALPRAALNLLTRAGPLASCASADVASLRALLASVDDSEAGASEAKDASVWVAIFVGPALST